MKYVKQQRGRSDGTTYWYFRRNGKQWRLPGEPGSVAFAQEYQRLIEATRQPRHVARQRPSETANGYVYFLRAGRRWKIGFSTKPLGRIRSLQTGMPHRADVLFAVSGHLRHERNLHKRLAVWRRSGEWFDDSPQLRKLLYVMLGRGTAWLDEDAKERQKNGLLGNSEWETRPSNS